MNNIQIPWPDWQVVRILGNGSFGSVYEIQRNVFGAVEKAALKVISIPKSQGDIDRDFGSGYDENSINEKYRYYLDDIVKEYQLMMGMKGNSNIVSCEDLYVSQNDNGIGWTVYIRMELLTPLLTQLKNFSYSESDVIRLGIDICKALVLCQENGIVHRDIKPENIMISKYGEYKLGDFGIARRMDHATRATMVGTVSYATPEVIAGRAYDSRVDIYSLGLLLYWLLNNRRMPFQPTDHFPSPEETMIAQSHRVQGYQLTAPLSGDAELQKIILKACEYDPERRYVSARDMLKDLEKLSVSQIAPAGSDSADYRGDHGTEIIRTMENNNVQKPGDQLSEKQLKRKHRRMIAAASLLVIIPVFFAIIGLLAVSQNRQQTSKPVIAESYYQRGIDFFNQEEYEDAAKEIEKAIVLEPDNAEYHLSLGHCFDWLDRNEEALREAKKAVELDPDNADYHWYVGILLKWFEEYEDAASEAKKAIELDPNDSENHGLLSGILISMEKYEDAASEADEGIKLDPYNGENYYFRGICMYVRGDGDKAVKDLKKAVELDPDNALYHNDLGWVLYMLDKDGAGEELQKAVELEPDNAEYKEDLDNYLSSQTDS